MKKRIEITLRVKQTLAISSYRSRVEVWCAECAAITEMVTPDVAAALSGVSARAIYRRVEEGKLHFIETENGLLFICHASLQAF